MFYKRTIVRLKGTGLLWTPVLFATPVWYTFAILNRLFFIKFVHSVIFWWQVLCLAYLLFAGITGTFNILVLIAVVSIFVNGFLLLVNNGRCPFTTFAENEGAERGSVTNLFLPDCLARNTFRVAFPFFIFELVLLAVRFFTG